MHTLDNTPQLMAELARILAEPKRVHMLLALMDGRAYTATELALMAEIAPSTASSHLQKMLEQGSPAWPKANTAISASAAPTSANFWNTCCALPLRKSPR
ncbi:MAG: winged helix-turn-helix transcriptional regulator [Vitreoscilla sp.]|nr:winged helix-turn-helix transcriptional regulator [Vitreoscilla sp.]